MLVAQAAVASARNQGTVPGVAALLCGVSRGRCAQGCLCALGSAQLHLPGVLPAHDYSSCPSHSPTHHPPTHPPSTATHLSNPFCTCLHRALQRLSMDRAVEEQLPLPPPQGAEAVEVEAEGPSPGPLSPEGAAGAAGGAAAAAAAAAAGSVAAPGGEAGWPQAPGEAPPLSSAGPGQEGVAAFPGWGALPALRRMSVSAGQGGGGPQGPGSPRQPASPAGSAAGRSPRAFARGAVAAPPGRPSLGRSSMGSPWGELAGPPTLGPPTLGRASMGSGFSVEVERLPDEGHHMAAALTHVPPLPPGALLPAGAGEEEEEDGQRSVTRLLGEAPHCAGCAVLCCA